MEDKVKENIEEEEKSPEELLLDEIYNKETPKQERAELIKKKLADDKEGFYQLDFFLNSYFSHIVENFYEDEEIFKDLTNYVLDDMKDCDCKINVGGKEVDVFNTTFNGDGKSNLGILYNLSKERRFDTIPWVLDCVARKGMSERLNVNASDKTKRSFLFYICQFGFAQKAFDIYVTFKSNYVFDVQTLMFGSCNIKDMFNFDSDLTKAIKEGDFDKYKQELEKAFEDVKEFGESKILPVSFEPDKAGLNFVGNLCLHNDHRFLEFLLDCYKDNPVHFENITKINNLNMELNCKNHMLQYSPMIAVLVNGKFEMIKAVLEHVLVHKTIKLDINLKDPRKRNIFHCVIYNKMIDDEQTLYLLKNYLFKLGSDTAFSAHNTSVDPLFNQLDSDGFLPVTLYVSKIKEETQKDEINQEMFKVLAENTDFKEVFNSPSQANIVHPLIQTIKSKLLDYFNKFVEISDILRDQIIYVEKTTRRSTIEYAFNSETPEFFEIILEALAQISSFDLLEDEKESLTLFDTFFSVIRNARAQGAFTVTAENGKNVYKHPLISYIQRLVDTIYTVTKDNEGRNGLEFLKDYKKVKRGSGEFTIDIPKPKIMKKMPPGIKKRIMADYNKKVEEAKKEAQEKAVLTVVMNSTEMLLNKAFEMNEIFSYKYLFSACKEKKINMGTFMECFNNQKSPEIFAIVLEEICKTESFENLESNFHQDNFYINVKTIVPSTDCKEFFTKLHNTAYLLNPAPEGAETGIHVNEQYCILCLELFKEHYATVPEDQKIPFITACLERASSVTFITRIIETIEAFKIQLPLAGPKGVENTLKETFKNLIFKRKYPLVVRLQDLFLKNVRSFYKTLCSKLETGEETKIPDEYASESLDEEENLVTSRRDIKERLLSVLKGATKFESYNQIDFSEAPDEIYQMMKGFMYCGSYAIVNIGYPCTGELANVSSQTLFVCTVAKEFKESINKFKDELTILEFFSSFKAYNDLAFELVDLDTPVTWLIDVEGSGSMNVFEQCLDHENIELAMKIINSCDISKVISVFPLREKNLKNLLNSDSIMNFLEFVSKNEEKMKRLIQSNDVSTIPYQRLLALNDRFEDGDEGEEGYSGIETNMNVMYMHNFRNQVIPKIGKEIPYFNLLFFADGSSRYVLDELVKKLKVADIKKLNGFGYQIGRLISMSWTPKTDFVEI